MKSSFHRSNASATPIMFAFLLALVVNTGLQSASAQTPPDPGAPGTHGADYVDYGSDITDSTHGFLPTTNWGTAKVEVHARVWYPQDLKPASPAGFPLLIFQHGRHPTCYDATTGKAYLEWPCVSGTAPTVIPSYQGYDYLAPILASNGFVVVSIGANGINAKDTSSNSSPDNGMAARAELIQEHLNLLCRFNGSGFCDQVQTGDNTSLSGLPAGLVGNIDFSHIGTMGHSRGGEGVVTQFNNNTNPNYVIKGVVSLAGTRFNASRVAQNVPVMGVLPYCDGDLQTLPTVGYYDAARYPATADNTPKYFVLVMGTDHNYYNTVWSPGFPGGNAPPGFAGTADDWDNTETASGNNSGLPTNVSGGSADSWCGTAATSGRLDQIQTQSTAIAYLSAFFRFHVNGETQFVHELTGDQVPPEITLLGPGPRSYIQRAYVSYQPAANKRQDVAHFDVSANTTISNPLGWAITTSTLADYFLCAEDVESETNPDSCFSITLDPNNNNGITGNGNANNNNAGNGNNNNNNNNGGSNAQPPARDPEPINAGLLAWNTTGTWTATAPAGATLNVSSYSHLQFRGCLDFDEARNDSFNFQDFTVSLSSPGLLGALGLSTGTADLAGSNTATNLFFPPGDDGTDDGSGQGPVPKCLLLPERIELSKFQGLLGLGLLGADLSEIGAIQFGFGTALQSRFSNVTPQGAVLINDLMFTADPEP